MMSLMNTNCTQIKQSKLRMSYPLGAFIKGNVKMLGTVLNGRMYLANKFLFDAKVVSTFQNNITKASQNITKQTHFKVQILQRI